MPDDTLEFVAENAEPCRLDRLVADRLGISRHAALELIAGGRVRLDGRRARKGASVRAGQRVAVARPLAALVPQPELDVPLLYADQAMLAFDKPAGMPAQALRVTDRGTLTNFLIARFPETAGASPDPLEAGIAHRLDNETSGVLLVARDRAAHRFLREQFRAGTVRKEYRAVVHGRLKRGARIESHLRPGGRRGQLMRAGSPDSPAARRAVSVYRPLWSDGEITLLAVEIETGVRHQIRAHLAGIGHPVLGDTLYGAAAAARLFLHAAAVEVTSPAGHRRIRVEAPLPPELERFTGA